MDSHAIHGGKLKNDHTGLSKNNAHHRTNIYVERGSPQDSLHKLVRSRDYSTNTSCTDFNLYNIKTRMDLPIYLVDTLKKKPLLEMQFVVAVHHSDAPVLQTRICFPSTLTDTSMRRARAKKSPAAFWRLEKYIPLWILLLTNQFKKFQT